jgi:pyruvyltransferase
MRPYRWREFNFGDNRRPVNKNRVNVYYWRDIENNMENVGDYLGLVVSDYIAAKNNISIESYFVKNTQRLLTIGSVVNSAAANTTIWGSGWHNHKARKPISNRLDIRAVRGPLTREKLIENGYKTPKIFGDPAILMPEIYWPTIEESRKILVIPHYKKFIKYEGCGYPTLNTLSGDWKRFIDGVVKSEVIISGSLHGLILAHVYDKKFAMLADVDTDLFKYRDYFLGVGMCCPQPYNCIDSAINNATRFEKIDQEIKRNLIDAFPLDLWSD